MNNARIARKLVMVARELTAKPPKMKKRWKDIKVDDKFKFKGQKMWKIDKNKAVNLKDVQTFRDSASDYIYEV